MRFVYVCSEAGVDGVSIQREYSCAGVHRFGDGRVVLVLCCGVGLFRICVLYTRPVATEGRVLSLGVGEREERRNCAQSEG